MAAHSRCSAWAFLLFTIGFVGYYAQGQLSIVNLTGMVQALLAGRGLGFVLFDPMSMVLPFLPPSAC